MDKSNLWINKCHSVYLWLAQTVTCFGVSSSEADHLHCRQSHSLVMVRVQFEFCLGIITVLHKGHLFSEGKKSIFHRKLGQHLKQVSMKEFCAHTVNYEVADSLATCMPSWLTTSNAPIMLNTNWSTLLKLSSPILQEPSMRNTRSALAPLHTGLCKNMQCSILEKK